MHQIIEGIGNEVLAIVFFFTILLAVVIPFYVLRPARQNLYEQRTEQRNEDSQENVTSTQNTVENSNNRTASDHDIQSGERTNNEPIGCTSTASNSSSANNTNSNVVNNGNTVNDENSEMISVKVMNQESFQMLTVSNNILLNDLKIKCFPVESGEGKLIRLIYAGRILQGDTYPLRYLGIVNGSVIHSVISDQSPTSPASNASENNPNIAVNDLDLSDLTIILLTLLLVLFWGLLCLYTTYFSTTSVVILSLLTFLFLIFVVAL